MLCKLLWRKDKSGTARELPLLRSSPGPLLSSWAHRHDSTTQDCHVSGQEAGVLNWTKEMAIPGTGARSYTLHMHS